MRPELREKVMEKLESRLVRLAENFSGKPMPKGWARRGLKSSGIGKAFETGLRRAPDRRFDSIMTRLAALDPTNVSRSLKMALLNMPKARGGRPPAFSLEVRRRAVKDIGNEYPECDRLTDAICLVAKRYGMSPDYLHKVWKNRKRLKSIEKEPSQQNG